MEGRRRELVVFLAILVLIINSTWSAWAKQTNATINRDTVGVWFNHSHCFHGRAGEQSSSPSCSIADLTLMARHVTSKFGTILLDRPPSDDDDFSLAAPSVVIPSVVAELNRNRTSSSSSELSSGSGAKVIMSFIVDDEAGNLDNFDTVRRIADHANEIHPGTVTTLLAQYTTIELQSWSRHHNYKSSFGDMRYWLGRARGRLTMSESKSKHDYRLGLMIEQEDCWQFGVAQPPVLHVLSGLKAALEVADVVLVFLNFDLSTEFGTSGTSSSSVLATITEFEECERQLKQVVKPELTVIPFAACFSERRISLRKFLDCWRLWSEWGVSHDGRQVVMFEAVDSHYALVYKHYRLHDLGWWRSAQGVPLGESSLIEKITELEPVFQLERSDSLIVSVDYTVRHLRNDSPLKYSRAEVDAMVELVTDKFPTVYYSTTWSSYWSQINSTLYVPSILAELNQKNHASRTNTNNTPSSALLSAMVAFEVYTHYNKYDFDAWSASLSSAKLMADKANGIHPGTVSTLVCQPSGRNDDSYYNLTRLVGFLPKARELLLMMSSGSGGVGNDSAAGTASFPLYKLGIRMSENDCEGINRMDYYRGWNKGNVAEFLKQLDLVVVTFKIGAKTAPLDAHGDRRHIQLKFHSCAEGLKRVRPATLRVIPALVCHESTEVQVVRCWQFAKEWADELGEQVVVFEAFDVPTQGRYAGWWKLDKVSNINISRDSFVEKAQDLALENETTSCVLNAEEDFADAGEEEESGNPREVSSEQHQNDPEIEQDKTPESSQHPNDFRMDDNPEEDNIPKRGDLEKSDETGEFKGDTTTQGSNISQSCATGAITKNNILAILCMTMFVVILGLGYSLVQQARRRKQGRLLPKTTRVSRRIHDDESNPNLTVSTPDSLDVAALISTNATSVAYTK